MEAALLGEGDGSLRLQALVRVGVTSPATGSELHASSTSYDTRHKSTDAGRRGERIASSQ